MRADRACLAWLAVLIFVAASASAQKTTDVLVVHLKDCSGSEDLTDSELIALDDQSEALDGTWQKTAKCTWKFRSKRTFSTDVTFNLRLDHVARTRCRVGHWNARENLEDIEFSLFGKVMNITLRPTDNQPIEYERVVLLDKSNHPGKEDERECNDTGKLTGSSKEPFTLSKAQTEIERIRLPHFLNPKDGCGIVVNLLPTVEKARKTRGIGNIGDEDIPEAVGRQGNAANGCHRPTQSGSEIDVVDRTAKRHRIHVEAN